MAKGGKFWYFLPNFATAALSIFAFQGEKWTRWKKVACPVPPYDLPEIITIFKDLLNCRQHSKIDKNPAFLYPVIWFVDTNSSY